ncbi:class I SAM-dependent methyltransferase [Marispirochaeta aestuarii]|uniref:class I SAM-dependent methyltransferase n=1 Tax=Marispirochaeta aestuarii TaxID=1963862 RepID=UPI0029C8566D|nr:class I SAM-dependent methyltransferase [Marispirochaeta aestuarii]
MNEKRRFRQRLKDFDLTLPESKKEYNRMLFTPVAQVYSGITRVLSFGRDAAWKRKLISLLPEIPEPRILDLACGPGDLSFLLALRYPSARIEGIDLNTDMLDRAASNLARMPENIQERIHFLPGDMNELPFNDGEFDIVSGGYALRNSPDLGRSLAEIHRMLKPGGYAAFLDFSRSSRKHTGRLQLGLLSFWGRLWGRVYHGNPEVYGYIAESLKSFPDQAEFLRLLEGFGFSPVHYLPRMFGMLRITVIRKN